MIEPLKKVFGFEAFRPDQEEIINNILDNRDVFAVMPTGGGKSLCYQLPAKIMEGMAVVISPLISLMKDQVDAVRENGVSAAFINSSLSQREISETYRSLRSHSLDLLYIAPERFAMAGFLETLRAVPISLFAVDEAHCISDWGHDFRPDYLNLSGITELFPQIPVAAFTATATQRVQDDIINRLGLRSPFTVRASFNRPNLFYKVEKKRNPGLQLLAFLAKHVDEPGIIYSTTRDSVNALSDTLKKNGIQALPYHAGLTQEDRKRNQEAFNRDEVDVIVATIAFGMGINKSNVRFVVHADLPKNIESYYQETGRAGRDGEPAECLLLFGRGDIPKIRYFIDQIPNDQERTVAHEKLNQMARYASHHVCRRKQLIEYFGEYCSYENCSTCDICTGNVEKEDITIDAQIVMSAISRTGQRFGIGHVIDIVTGAETKRIRELAHHQIKTYGTGSYKDKKRWHYIVDELLAQDAVYQDGSRYPVLKLTEKGNNILYGRAKINGLKEEKPPSGRGGGFEPYDETLFGKLRAIRKKLADEQQMPPYIIFSDRTIHEMCRYFPSSLPDMSKISGVGEAKLARYGPDFIKSIKSYLDNNPGISIRKRRTAVPSTEPVRNKTKGETFEKTYELFTKGLSTEEIAKERTLAISTIASHLERLILECREIDIDRLVPPEKRDEISKLFSTLQSWQLGPVVEHFKGWVGYKEAKFVRAYIQRKSNNETLSY